MRSACFYQMPRVAQVATPHRVRQAPAARRLVSCSAQAPAASPARINVQGKHLEVTGAINEYVQKKVGHAVDPYKSVVQDIDVRLSVRGGDASRGERQQKIEVTIRTARHGVIRAEETRDDMYASIDVASDKIHRSLRKLKEKSVKKGQWPGGRGFAKGAPAVGDVLPIDDLEIVPSDDEVEAATANLDMPQSVKRTKVFYLDSMNLQDAIDQLEQVDHDFYIYLDADSGHVQVVYKRNTDGHGVIITIPDETSV
eukprot:jgi/Ulvmu1/8959/UM005_0050.1